MDSVVAAAAAPVVAGTVAADGIAVDVAGVVDIAEHTCAALGVASIAAGVVRDWGMVVAAADGVGVVPHRPRSCASAECWQTFDRPATGNSTA